MGSIGFAGVALSGQAGQAIQLIQQVAQCKLGEARLRISVREKPAKKPVPYVMAAFLVGNYRLYWSN